MSIQALIFDFDGTLVFINNWSDYWIGVFEKTILKMGGEYEGCFDSIKSFSLGDFDEKDEKLKQWRIRASLEEFLVALGHIDHDERLNLLRRNETGFYSDVNRFLRFIKSNKMSFGIVTYSLKETVDEYFLRYHIDSTYDAIYDRRLSISTKQWKPSPRPIIELSRQLQVSPDQVMVVGDREMDVESGFLSGSKTALIQRGDNERAGEVLENLQQKNVEPDIIVCSLDELMDHMVADIL